MDLPEEAKWAPSAPVWNQSFPSPNMQDKLSWLCTCHTIITRVRFYDMCYFCDNEPLVQLLVWWRHTLSSRNSCLLFHIWFTAKFFLLLWQTHILLLFFIVSWIYVQMWTYCVGCLCRTVSLWQHTLWRMSDNADASSTDCATVNSTLCLSLSENAVLRRVKSGPVL